VGIEISISKKGLMKFGIISSINFPKKMSLLLFPFFIFLLLNVSSVSANHVLNTTLENGTQRIVPTGGVIANLTLMINNTADSTHVINGTNITNATGYPITGITTPTGWTCTIGATISNCTSTSGAGISVGSYATFYVAVTTPAALASVTTWIVNTTDTNNNPNNATLSMLAVASGGIGFDLRDELGNIMPSGTNVTITTVSGLVILVNNVTDGSNVRDTAADGLVLFSQGSELSGASGDGTYYYNITRDGFVTQTTDTLSYLHAGFNPNKVSLQYYIKITVQDELGNVLTGATVNVTDTTPGINSTTTANKTVGNVQYFAMNTTYFGNVTFIISKTGFITNGSAAGTFYLVNSSVQQTGISPYQLRYSLKLTVQNELSGTASMSSGITVALNGTDTAAAQSSANVYYFNRSAGGVNITAAKTGYINTSSNNIAVNATTQALSTISLPFALKVNVTNELNGIANMDSGVTVAVNGTDTASTNSSSQYYYFALSPQDVNLTVSKSGYVNSTNNVLLVNASTQAFKTIPLSFSLKVMQICDELNNTCFAMDGSASFVGLTGVVTNYSTYGYIPASAGSATVTAGKNGYINSSKTVTASSASQTQILFNQSGAAGMQNASALQYSIKVVAICDELNKTCPTINGSIGTVSSGGAEVVGNATVYNSTGYAYIPATGVGNAIVKAFSLGYINRSQTVALTGVSQTLVYFNSTYPLQFALKLTVQDELSGTASMSSGITVALNGTDTAAAQSSANVYYFNRSAGGVNITAAKTGYINTSSNNIAVNATTQALSTISLPFALKVNVTNELNGIANMDSGVTVAVNGTDTASTNSSSQYYYFALSPQDVNLTVSKSGYVNSTNNVLLVNASTQAFKTIPLSFSLKVMQICDELNNTCFAMDGSASFVGLTGVVTNYSTYGYIPASAGSATVTAGKNGYINSSKTVTASSASQTQILFNQSGAAGMQNASALQYSIKVVAICDELNKTCPTINGSIGTVSSGGAEVVGNATVYNSTGYAYIPATGVGNAIVKAFSLGYINRSQTVALTGVSQTLVYFNSTYPLQFALKLTVQDELSQSTGMSSGVALALNSTWKSENAQFWRSSSSSNVYYFNLTTAGYDITAGKVGYINTSANNTPVNATTQALQTISLPYVAKITVRAQNNELINGSYFTMTYGGGQSIAFFDGSSSDGDTSRNGVIYYALNKSAIPTVSKFSVTYGSFSGEATNETGPVYVMNDTTQTSLTVQTNAPKPYNFTPSGFTGGTWERFWLPTQAMMTNKGYTATSTNNWNISSVLELGGLGTNYDVVYYYTSGAWKIFIRADWSGSTLQYMNNTNEVPYWINMTTSSWLIL